MRWSKTKVLVSTLGVLLSLAYPFTIYMYSGTIGPSYLILGLVMLLSLRCGMMLYNRQRGAFGLLIAIVSLLILNFIDEHLATLLYPVVTSLSFAFMLGWSLLYPPTFIEYLARLKDKDLDERGVKYTRGVTIVWMVFCLVNASLALATVWLGDKALWLLYNTCISYILTGVLMVGEYLFRIYYKQKGKLV